jgi:hypothetical protein
MNVVLKVFATIFRVVTLLLLCGLVIFLGWLYDTQNKQSDAFLDEQVSNGYAILQSSKEAQWADVATKKTAFKETFLDNQPVGLNDENPLENALDELKASENIILRGKDYRDELDVLAMEFGPPKLNMENRPIKLFLWDSVGKVWKPNANAKPEGIAALKNPFSDEKKFPMADFELEGMSELTDDKLEAKAKEYGIAAVDCIDGTVIPGVSRENRLRTVMGMLYKNRNDLYGEIASLRSNVLERDQQLRESQNLFNDMKNQKEEWEAKSNDFELKLQNTEADLEEEKKLRKDENEAAEQQIMVLNNNIAGLEQQKVESEKMHTAEIDTLKEEHGGKLSQLQREIKLAAAAGYQRGIDEMLAKQKGGVEALADQDKANNNPFGAKEDGPPQKPDTVTQETTELTMMNEYGIPSSIARIDSRSGMLILPIGSGRGLNQGEIFTLWKGKTEAARIKVQSTQKGYSLAYILPQFGEPNRLRPGDHVQIVPEKQNTL